MDEPGEADAQQYGGDGRERADEIAGAGFNGGSCRGCCGHQAGRAGPIAAGLRGRRMAEGGQFLVIGLARLRGAHAGPGFVDAGAEGAVPGIAAVAIRMQPALQVAVVGVQLGLRGRRTGAEDAVGGGVLGEEHLLDEKARGFEQFFRGGAGGFGGGAGGDGGAASHFQQRGHAGGQGSGSQQLAPRGGAQQAQGQIECFTARHVPPLNLGLSPRRPWVGATPPTPRESCHCGVRRQF